MHFLLKAYDCPFKGLGFGVRGEVAGIERFASRFFGGKERVEERRTMGRGSTRQPQLSWRSSIISSSLPNSLNPKPQLNPKPRP